MNGRSKDDQERNPRGIRGTFGWWRLGIWAFALFVAVLLIIRGLG